jgi:hypothetical protein
MWGKCKVESLCWSLPNYRAKEKKKIRWPQSDCVPWFGHFFLGVVEHFLGYHLLIVNVAFEDKFVSFCNSFLSSTLFDIQEHQFQNKKIPLHCHIFVSSNYAWVKQLYVPVCTREKIHFLQTIPIIFVTISKIRPL